MPIQPSNRMNAFTGNPPVLRQKTPETQPKFGNAIFNLTRSMDFAQLGQSAVAQNQLIYGTVIGSRVGVAASRSMNEVREVVSRDALGWTMWFYATPMLLRGYLGLVDKMDPNVGALLLQPKPHPNTLFQAIPNPTFMDRAKHQISRLTYYLNPLQQFDMPSTKQLDQVKNQMLEKIDELAKSGVKAYTAEEYKGARQAIESLYSKAKLHRNMASFIGIMTTILLLGIGIPFLNIVLTKKNVEAKRKAAQQKQQPQLNPMMRPFPYGGYSNPMALYPGQVGVNSAPMGFSANSNAQYANYSGFQQ